MYSAPDGTRWHTGIRYFYGGQYHMAPPFARGFSPSATRTTYQVFAPFENDGSLRLYALREGQSKRPDGEELARRFQSASYARRERYDPAERTPW